MRAARIAGGVSVAWVLGVVVNRSLRRVHGHSMQPTLDPGDLVVVAPARRPRRGQIVLVRDPRDPSRVQIKRVIGLPGEHLRIERGVLSVDGVHHVEPYATGGGPNVGLLVPDAHVAVLGDARTRSTDSRTYGPVPLELLDARVVARVAPRPSLLGARPRSVRLVRGDAA